MELLLLQMDVAELEEADITDDFEGEYVEGGEDDEDDYTEENINTARRSLASIFGDTEVVEVDETQADESLLVWTQWRLCAASNQTFVCQLAGLLHGNRACCRFASSLVGQTPMQLMHVDHCAIPLCTNTAFC